MIFGNRKCFSAVLALLLCVCAATSAFAGGAKNAFTGKTYVMTGVYAGGMDITGIMNAAGVNLKMEITFTGEAECRIQVTADGETEESSGEYTVNAKEKTLTIRAQNESDPLVFSYSDDYSTLKVSEVLQEGIEADLVLTEKGKEKEKIQPEKPKIDYGSVKTNVFKGKTYRLTKVLINGMDASSLIAMTGEQFTGSLKFIDGKNVILDFSYGSEAEKESGTYTVDYKNNTITFDGDKENGTAVFYNKGSVIDFSLPLDGGDMTLNLVFEK